VTLKEEPREFCFGDVTLKEEPTGGGGHPSDFYDNILKSMLEQKNLCQTTRESADSNLKSTVCR
jgi:hypothetical protein